MASFVLVHGAGVGGWCWKRIVPLLRSAGHEVYTPTLTGLGERAHLLSADVGLETHIQDIVNVIEYEDLTDVILVGHSRGIIVAAGAADREIERVTRLIYVDWFLPVNGLSVLELTPEDFRAWMSGLMTETSRGNVYVLPDGSNFGLSDQADIDWFNAKATPEPVKGWTEPLVLRDEAALAQIPRTYINCIGDAPDSAEPPDWTKGMDYRELHAGHLAMMNAPQEFATLLTKIAAPQTK